MFLISLEEIVKSNLNIEKINSDLVKGFGLLIEKVDNASIKKEFITTLNGGNYKLEFSGITVHVLNSNKRKPFFRARMNIYSGIPQINVAYYEIEYGLNGEILDDYFDIN